MPRELDIEVVKVDRLSEEAMQKGVLPANREKAQQEDVPV
jgi:hypothetical protein